MWGAIKSCREISCVTLIFVYIPPEGDKEQAANAVSAVVAEIEEAKPDATVIITGDFNNATLSTSLPLYTQYINILTCGEFSGQNLWRSGDHQEARKAQKKLDKDIANRKEEYKQKIEQHFKNPINQFPISLGGIQNDHRLQEENFTPFTLNRAVMQNGRNN
ncbi:hypothetical protein CAPTEDRAFT_191138 [Capitella teleta]|uniref:Endonuclease/exonuclease/phosphatase domain-containing protein n=1 Tax=Capitella teleta TaxID=283909 RepID=R7UYZ2_CAPTE|nr:hypothetical protein CAPTEDRAFT_191138 [Capitella teleta]|eukprot:ELU08621.1 hypothetical protein CAPTEDRAFT_191138 [Capitella teleta]